MPASRSDPARHERSHLPPMNDSKDGRSLTAGVYRRQPHEHPWPDIPVPQPADLNSAFATVRAVWPVTPLLFSVQLSRLFDREVYLKLENLAPVRSFKFRGALVAASAIAGESSGRHIFTASTGNHGQGVAYAASRFGLDVTVCSPANALAEKLQAMRDLGATVSIVGDNLSQAQAAAAQLADEAGGVYLEDGEDGGLMAGAATIAREVVESSPSMATLVVPVGGGNLIAGSLLARQHLESDMNVIGVQSTAASGATASWLAGEVVSRSCSTFAGGLATEYPGELAWSVMDAWLRTMALVDEADLYRGVATAFREAGLIVEGAAAATIAALSVHGGELPGDPVALLVSGSWLSMAEFNQAITT